MQSSESRIRMKRQIIEVIEHRKAFNARRIEGKQFSFPPLPIQLISRSKINIFEIFLLSKCEEKLNGPSKYRQISADIHNHKIHHRPNLIILQLIQRIELKRVYTSFHNGGGRFISVVVVASKGF